MEKKRYYYKNYGLNNKIEKVQLEAVKNNKWVKTIHKKL